MLEPLDRRCLFDALRPPRGYDVDVAIGTTFSLDLLALLAVPLAFAWFDWEDDQGRVNADPTMLLEAARRYADRTHIFCQAGQIHLPRQRSPLLYQLEGIVHEVEPPDRHGVFHPKVWILRFVPITKGHPLLYRVLCLSRNLTFDRSWDTLLVLEGKLGRRKLAVANNHPLGDFVQELPKMMTGYVSAGLRKTVNRVHRELRRVRFAAPEGFEEVRFHALGLVEGEEWWFKTRRSKALAMAPFMDWGFVKQLAAKSEDCVLISRLEQLQEMKPGLLEGCGGVFYLDPLAERPDPSDAADEEGVPGDTERSDSQREPSLSGLHAKLFITDEGWKSSVWTGSPNATTAAFGRNVEFLVQLRGKKSLCGVDAFLDRGKGRFSDLLREFRPGEETPNGDPDVRKAEQLAGKVQQFIARLGLRARVKALSNEAFTVRVGPVGRTGKMFQAEAVEVTCWPLTLPERDGVTAQPLFKGEDLLFGPLSFESLTSFFAFHVKGSAGSRTHEIRFVLNLPVEGMPANREDRMLRIILHNRSRILAMLLLLLEDRSGDLLARLAEASGDGKDSTGRRLTPLGEAALLEALLKMLEREPIRLERVARLVDDLKKVEGGTDLLPKGFLAVWEPIWHIARERMDAKK